MDFEWMEEIGWLKKIKDAISIRQRLGDVLNWMPKASIVQSPPERQPGISALMRLKNEAQWIETTLRSLAPFVEQFSIVDNGSTDDTPQIIRRVAEELSLDYVLEILPTNDFGVVCDRALANTTCRWVVRWDGDMIARTQGEQTFGKIRNFALSLDTNRYYVIYFPHICLGGDLFHQNPEQLIHYEDWLFTYSPSLHHRRTGRFREMIYPLYYKRLYIWETTSFHITNLDNPCDLIQRKYWEEWRTLKDSSLYPTLESFAKSKINEEYGTDSFEEAGAMYLRESFRHLVPYNKERFGDYPENLKHFLDSFPLRLTYRNGKISGRSDIINILNKIDNKKRQMSVDVIVPTRNREEYAVATVEKLLEQDYPNYRVIVCDQSDRPSELLRLMADFHERLLYHVAISRGLPESRNEALALSNADIVIFVDDDIIPEQGFIEGHVLAYSRRDCGGIAGKIIDKRPSMMKSITPENTGKINFLTGKLNRGFTHDIPMEVDSAPGGNMSFRRTVLEKAGGFDTRYGGTALFEETDISLSVRKLGYRIHYTPDASLTHLGVSTGGCRIDDINIQAYWYGHNFTLLFMKHFPRSAFPLFFIIRLAKFARDCIKKPGLKPLISGLKGMYDGFRAFYKKI